MSLKVAGTLGAALLAACMAGCMAGFSGGAASPPSAGAVTVAQALAQAACPHRVEEARAWVNRMPSVGKRQPMLNVSVTLAGKDDRAILIRSGTSTADTLVLEIRSADQSPLPGRAAFREPLGDGQYAKVVLQCRGGAVHEIAEIQRVY